MIPSKRVLPLLVVLTLVAPLAAQNGKATTGRSANGKAPTEADLATAKPGRDPNQPIDEEYTKGIKKYTTETFFNSPLTDYLPASKTVPTPKAILGDVAGAEGKLPYSKEVYDYMRLLARSTPRVKVFTIGTTEEGREMIAVAVASEALMAKLDANKADLAKLADPRSINFDDAVADEIAKRAAPVYYITGTIHSTETGAPSALMELAYRLAVDESPYVKAIRDGMVTLITPVVEVDGRDRMVDIYNWHLAHPNQNWPPLIYWGHYVAHDGISRLYETFGNGGADTLVRTLSPDEYSRTWYRQNPPLPRAKWSQRNNNNYEETALLISLDYFNRNSKLFLKNFYLKSKRSIEKPKNEGPAAYVFPADDPRLANQATLLRLLQAQGCEVHRATAPFTVAVKKKKSGRSAAPRTAGTPAPTPALAGVTQSDAVPRAAASPPPSTSPMPEAEKPAETETRTFPAGSYIVRMDQPYSRIADALLDYQYWSPRDPQQDVYDDTGWTFGELGNLQVVRVTDVKVLDAAMERINGEVRSPGGINGTGSIFVVNHNADNTLITLRYRLRKASFEAAEEPFEAAGRKFNRGSFIIRNASSDELGKALTDLGLQAAAVDPAPVVKTHAIKVP